MGFWKHRRLWLVALAALLSAKIFCAEPQSRQTIHFDVIVWPAFSQTVLQKETDTGEPYLKGWFLGAEALSEIRGNPVLRRIGLLLSYLSPWQYTEKGWILSTKSPVIGDDVKKLYLTTDGLVRSLVGPVHTTIRLRVGNEREPVLIMNNHGWNYDLVRKSIAMGTFGVVRKAPTSSSFEILRRGDQDDENVVEEVLDALVYKTFDHEVTANFAAEDLYNVLKEVLQKLFYNSSLDENVTIEESPELLDPTSLRGILSFRSKHLCNDDALLEKATFDFLTTRLGKRVWETPVNLREYALGLEAELLDNVIFPGRRHAGGIGYHSSIGFLDPRFPGNCNRGDQPTWPAPYCPIDQ